MTTTKAPGAMTREMDMVHTGLLREYRLMPATIAGVAEGDLDRAALVAGHIELVATVLHHHHHSEDRAIWPRLLERCPDVIAPLVNRMERHHERIAYLSVDFTAAVATWRAEPTVANRAAVLTVLDPLVTVLREHLQAEIADVLPLIEQHITAAEWDAMVAEGAADLPVEQIPLMFGILMYEGDPGAIEDALANLPAEARDMISELAPRLYADRAEALYGTRTPPKETAAAH
ncbi:hemerythrin domain-containing protein [Amycolatopsis rhabdoformis]|uniref:Hemerythrin domain-containing protein n=1 Tax=Amycolatopsis rhabdoformis TaxID=1448059 RepID=A0ABZ1IGT9_9PSEU|nr:hemerythrin domain-containing protein [Amycolatopsis rhabdoformis]WSE32981.1 hemerythrin domain-containing protein [Amycolatopsis rhabdoformis]